MTSLAPRGRQSDVIYHAPTRHQVVLGTAGTGKSTMAMLRAAFLAHPTNPGGGNVLLVTYNNALVTYLRHLAPTSATRVQVQTYHRFARGYLKSLGLMRGFGVIATPETQRALITSAVNSIAAASPPSRLFQRDVTFFVDEIDWISDMGILNLDDYLKVERHGRRRGLDDAHRQIVWAIRELYLALRNNAGHSYDWHDIATAAKAGLEVDSSPRLYRHVVIDEGQDLSPEAIRSLALAVPEDGSVTFFGDYHQQIYGQGLSWRSCGLKIRETEKFSDNYRNTGEIARVAIAMSRMGHMAGETDDLVEPVEPTAAGPKPTLVRCRSETEELAIVATQAAQYAKSGTVAVLARTWEEANRACKGLKARRLLPNMRNWDATPGIYCGAYHSAKGLEFDAVIMPFCDAEHVPHREVVASFGTEEATRREGRLIYVGITRARTDLLVTYTNTPSHLLPLDDKLWVQVAI